MVDRIFYSRAIDIQSYKEKTLSVAILSRIISNGQVCSFEDSRRFSLLALPIYSFVSSRNGIFMKTGRLIFIRLR